MIITIEQISEVFDNHQMDLIGSYIDSGCHCLLALPTGSGAVLESIAIHGVKFANVGRRCSAVIYRCVFSGEVLQNSVKVNFECTK